MKVIEKLRHEYDAVQAEIDGILDEHIHANLELDEAFRAVEPLLEKQRQIRRRINALTPRKELAAKRDAMVAEMAGLPVERPDVSGLPPGEQINKNLAFLRRFWLTVQVHELDTELRKPDLRALAKAVLALFAMVLGVVLLSHLLVAAGLTSGSGAR